MSERAATWGVHVLVCDCLGVRRATMSTCIEPSTNQPAGELKLLLPPMDEHTRRARAEGLYSEAQVSA